MSKVHLSCVTVDQLLYISSDIKQNIKLQLKRKKTESEGRGKIHLQT
jgi:hypothetical protein